MSAKEMFEKLGYIQEIYENQEKPRDNSIEYTQHDESKFKETGMKYDTIIQFCHNPKPEIYIGMDFQHRSGTESENNATTLSLEEFYAIQKQVEELKEQNIWK